MTRSILFDADGVLIHSRFHPDTARRRLWDDHLLADMGIEPAKFQTLFGPQFEAVVTGKTALISVLDEFLPTVGYRDSTLSFITYWLERDTHLNFELVASIRELRRKAEIRVFLATNQEHLRASYLWRHFRLEHVFDDMLYAARLGAMKPDRGFYETAASHLSAHTEPPLLFDDSAKCVAGANEFGWQGVLFNDLEDFTTHPWIAERLG